MIILGITGLPASGKDTIGDYLAQKGFSKFNMSDVIREEMRSLYLPVDRTSMQNYMQEKRKAFGNDYLCDAIVKKVTDKTIISGIRNRDEINAFKKSLGNNFLIVAVNSPIERRYESIKQRNREGDNITFEQFKLEEEKESYNSSGGLEIKKVMEMADFSINNDGTKDDLYKKVDELISKLTI